MRTRSLLVAIVVALSLIGCQKQQPAIPKPVVPALGAIKPVAVTTNDGIDHEFYRDVSLDAFLKAIPSGSLDSLDMNFAKEPQVFVLVKVPEQPGKDLSMLHFETTFKTGDGQVIDKRWTAAKDRKPGKVTALFCLPSSIKNGETKIVQDGD